MEKEVVEKFKSVCGRTMNAELKEGDGRTKIDDKLSCKTDNGTIAVRTDADIATLETKNTKASIHNPSNIRGSLGEIEVRSDIRENGLREKLKVNATGGS